MERLKVSAVEIAIIVNQRLFLLPNVMGNILGLLVKHTVWLTG